MIFLAQVVVLQAGYALDGGRGWAHADDLRSAAGRDDWAGILLHLEQKGFAESRDVSTASAREPALLYRITQAGIDEAAKRLGERTPVLRTPSGTGGHSGVYLPKGARWALQVLRERYPDWLSVSDVRAAADRWNASGKLPYRFVFTTDCTALVLAGYAESNCFGECAAHGYRVTEDGRTAPVLEWNGYDPEAEIFFDHDGRRLLAPPCRIAFFGSGN